MRRFLAFGWLILLVASSTVFGQVGGESAELQRFQGRWQVVDLVEDGQSIRQEAFKTVLQSGGQAEIVSNTIQFTVSATGARVAKVFSIDATTYPKSIAVSSLDRTEDVGIYKFEGERLIICVADPAAAARPTQFASRPGSKHMLMVMERAGGNTDSLIAGSPESAAAPVIPHPLFQPAPTAEVARIETSAPAPKMVPIETPAPATQVIQIEQAAPAPEVIKVQLPAPPVAAPVPLAAAPVLPAAAPIPTAAAPRVLTDAEVAVMLRGSWRLNDGAGVLQVTFDATGTYRTFREVQDPSTFYKVFVETPVSAGMWSVQNGTLAFHVTSSTDMTRINQTFYAAVRSISESDLIFIDPVGRVVKAVRL